MQYWQLGRQPLRVSKSLKKKENTEGKEEGLDELLSSWARRRYLACRSACPDRSESAEGATSGTAQYEKLVSRGKP